MLLHSLGAGIQQAFFDSLTRAGCVSLDTYGPDSDEEEDLEMGQDAVLGGSQGLVGFNKFKHDNPRSDKFEVLGFHHIDFWCGDATCVSKRFSWGLGMPTVAKSDQTTGNKTYASYVLQSGELLFSFTAPYSSKVDQTGTNKPNPKFNSEFARTFFASHGLAVRAVAVNVTDATQAYEVSLRHGAVSAAEPVVVEDSKEGGKVTLAEVILYGDVVLRFVSLQDYTGPFLPGFEKVESSAVMSYGLSRLDHAVGNVPNLLEYARHIAGFTGFHEFAEFTSEDVGTVDSGLNSMVLASNNEMVLLPINEPTFGTKRKSQIQTYLEHNEGPGLQHLALMATDIFHTLREMRLRSDIGGFEFMPRPSAKYYAGLPAKVGGDLTAEQLKECEELGLLVDKDREGILLQIFTKPLGDR